MPAVSEKQRIAMAIAEHEPSKLYKRNKGMTKMTHQQLHDFAIKTKKSTKGSPSFMEEELKQGYRKLGN